ncbi:MAG: hypothetical protein ACYCOX_02515 [Acidobacteriaceae bacterium]
MVPKYHYPPKKQKMPRPISKEELELVWDLLHQRGTSLVKFAMAAGEESGIRISEMRNLRIEDVDLDGPRFFIRLPNQTNTESWALFSEKTEQYYLEWMTERKANCGHRGPFPSLRSRVRMTTPLVPSLCAKRGTTLTIKRP